MRRAGRNAPDVKSTQDLIGHAAARSSARRPRFRASGQWRTAPVDLVARRGGSGSSTRVAVAERGRSLTYGELDATVDGAVAALRHEGITAGDAVFVLTTNDIVSVVAVHAVLRLGALVMVAPTSAGAAQVRDIVDATEPSVVLAPAPLLPGRDVDSATRWLLTDTIGAAEPVRDTSAAGRDPDEPAMVIFTSGTTSRPKGVVHSLNTMLGARRATTSTPRG